MEEIVRRIVDADKQARHQVCAKKQERRNVQNLIQKQKEEIKQKYQEETMAIVAKRRAELEDALNHQLQQEQKNYEEAIASMQKIYEDHKEEWVSTIYDRCLDL